MPSAKVGAILDLSPPTTHTPKPLGSSRTEQTPRGRRPAEEPSDCERWTSRPTRDIGLCVLRWPPRRPATLPIHPARTRMPRKLSRTPQPRRRTALVLALPAPMPGGALHNMAMSNARVFALSELQRPCRLAYARRRHHLGHRNASARHGRACIAMDVAVRRTAMPPAPPTLRPRRAHGNVEAERQRPLGLLGLHHCAGDEERGAQVARCVHDGGGERGGADGVALRSLEHAQPQLHAADASQGGQHGAGEQLPPFLRPAELQQRERLVERGGQRREYCSRWTKSSELLQTQSRSSSGSRTLGTGGSTKLPFVRRTLCARLAFMVAAIA